MPREEKEAHAPCRRFHPQGATETLEPEHVWDGWEWLANPDAPSAAVLAGPHIMRPHSHPAEVAKRAAAEAAWAHEAAERTEDATTGEAAREALYERAAFAVFVEAASDGFDEYAAAMAAASGHDGDGDWGGGD